jgi:hypothetical protein
MLGLRSRCLVRPTAPPAPPSNFLWLELTASSSCQVADNSGGLIATVIDVLKHGPHSHGTVGESTTFTGAG